MGSILGNSGQDTQTFSCNVRALVSEIAEI